MENLGIFPKIPTGLIKNEKECINSLFCMGVIPRDKPSIRYVAVAEHPNGTIYSAVLPYTYPSNTPWREMADKAHEILESAFPQVSFWGSKFSIELVDSPSGPSWIDHPNDSHKTK